MPVKHGISLGAQTGTGECNVTCCVARIRAGTVYMARGEPVSGQSVSQPVNQAVSQSVGQSVAQSASQPASQSPQPVVGVYMYSALGILPTLVHPPRLVSPDSSSLPPKPHPGSNRERGEEKKKISSSSLLLPFFSSFLFLSCSRSRRSRPLGDSDMKHCFADDRPQDCLARNNGFSSSKSPNITHHQLPPPLRTLHLHPHPLHPLHKAHQAI